MQYNLISRLIPCLSSLKDAMIRIKEKKKTKTTSLKLHPRRGKALPMLLLGSVAFVTWPATLYTQQATHRHPTPTVTQVRAQWGTVHSVFSLSSDPPLATPREVYYFLNITGSAWWEDCGHGRREGTRLLC